jgi:predicted Rossmann fold nucleotide-binding protein DprA/Smf involved in DNA uptake
MKLVIAGSRSIKDYNVTRQAIIESGLWHKHGKKIVVVSGLAEGPDKHGLTFSEKAGLKKPIKKAADWDNIKVDGALVRYNRSGKPYNALAGHWRNQEMADIADAALVVWDGRSTGSLDMVHRMLALDKECYLYPLRISADLLESLEAKGCIILHPNSLTQDK